MRRLGKQGSQAIEKAANTAREIEQVEAKAALRRLKNYLSDLSNKYNISWDENGHLIEKEFKP